MSLKAAAKYIIQKGLTPFLSDAKQQKRVVILHEIEDQYQNNFHDFLDLVQSLPASMDITITFDDGFYSSYEAIKQIPPDKAIFFVCPEFINRANTSTWEDFFHNNLRRTEDVRMGSLKNAVRPASWENLQELVGLGYRIGSHTMNHARLSGTLSTLELERELIGSADMIEDKIQIPVDALAYPFGNVESIHARSLDIIKKRYAQCFSGVRGNNIGNSNPYAILRDTIHFPWKQDYMRFILKGGLDWRYRNARRMLRQFAS